MRRFLLLLGLVLFLVGTASAQTSSNPMLLAAPFSMSSAGVSVASASSPAFSNAYASSTSANSDAAAAPATSPFSTASAPAPAPDPQYVQGVFVNYDWQAYVGYTFLHFGADHGISRNMNGLNWGIVHYFKSWFGVEGEMIATHDSPGNNSSWFLFGGGGPRFRWLGPKNIEVFAHGLVGYSHLTPQTSFGDQEAFAFEVGGGADFPTPFRRLALRVGADMVGSLYYHDNQYNPKAYGGIVFKF